MHLYKCLSYLHLDLSDVKEAIIFQANQLLNLGLMRLHECQVSLDTGPGDPL